MDEAKPDCMVSSSEFVFPVNQSMEMYDVIEHQPAAMLWKPQSINGESSQSSLADIISQDMMISSVMPWSQHDHERPKQRLCLSLELPQQILSNSKYLFPAQDLLNQFCSLHDNSHPKSKASSATQLQQTSLLCLDLLQLQTTKSKLIQMLHEVDRRYKYYSDQIKSMISSFESMAGEGSAMVYSRMASKAMSRHFRRLRDGIMSQIAATNKAIVEKDVAVPGTTKGETPRLRLLEQTLRQQKAIQQISLINTHPWRPQRGLPEKAVSVLRAWLFEHFLHPYPCDVDKHILATKTGLSRSQVSNWFINARVRLWKPMVEEMYMEELKEKEATSSKDFVCQKEDEKPTLVSIDSESLSSIILKNQQFINSYEADFTTQGQGMTFNGGGGGVSLTLGLYRQNRNMELEFYYGREQNEQLPLLEQENKTLPYRNLMGAQLLHELA